MLGHNSTFVVECFSFNVSASYLNSGLGRFRPELHFVVSMLLFQCEW